MACAEIGAFIGEGSLLIETHLCSSHPDSRLYCVDPWDDTYVREDPSGVLKDFDWLCKGQHDKFLTNTRGLEKIIQIRGVSDEKIPHLPHSIDFAYVDGNHHPDQVYRDAMNLYTKMKMSGIILFDDYSWEYKGLQTKRGIDQFIEETKVEILFSTRQQVAVRRQTSATTTTAQLRS